MNDHSALLVLDTITREDLPKSFRRTDAKVDFGQVDTYGLHKLRASGSGSVCQDQVLRISSSTENAPFYVVDLRKEAHGQINGFAVSWYAEQNGLYESLSPDEAKKDEALRLEEVRNGKSIVIHHIISKNQGTIDQLIPVTTFVDEVTTEREMVEGLGLNYQRIFATDHCPPPLKEVDRFVAFVQSLPENAWIHLHCRAGRGRTTTFMVLLDILHNGKVVALEDILLRQELIGGKNLQNLPREGSFKYEKACARLERVQQFYDYVRQNDDDFQSSFSSYVNLLNREKES